MGRRKAELKVMSEEEIEDFCQENFVTILGYFLQYVHQHFHKEYDIVLHR